MGMKPIGPSYCQEGERAVIPRIPQISDLGFHFTTGSRNGHPNGCDLSLQICMDRPFVCAMKLVQTVLLSEPATKWSKTGLVFVIVVTLDAARKTSMARRTSGGKSAGGGLSETGSPGITCVPTNRRRYTAGPFVLQPTNSVDAEVAHKAGMNELQTSIAKADIKLRVNRDLLFMAKIMAEPHRGGKNSKGIGKARYKRRAAPTRSRVNRFKQPVDNPTAATSIEKLPAARSSIG